MNLSVILITKDAARTLARTLASLKFVDEIIVVDSGSTDATLEVAKSFGAKVFTNPWPGYGPQKNFGLSKAVGEWALFIDADEEVTPELAQAIKTAISQPQPSYYWLKIVTIFLGRPIEHLYGHNPRLFRKDTGRWTSDQVHEQVERMSGERIKLGDIHSAVIADSLLHHSHPTIVAYLARMHSYTTLDAQQMKLTNRHRSGRPVTKSWWLPWQLAARQFIKLYLYRRGFLDGYAGFMWSLLSAYYEYEMATKYLTL